MVSIIFFPGMGATPKSINYEYDQNNNKYIPNDFIESLKKLNNVMIPDLSYKHILYYQKTNIDGWKDRYDVINNLTMADISIKKFINNFSFDHNKKYVLIGQSDGIYYAMEFARQYPEFVEHIISLDGSWISKHLCKIRLANWEKKGKIVKPITTQDELNNIMNKIKNENNNNEYIQRVFDHIRLEHTNICIKYAYENIIKNINYTIFRDFNGDASDDVNKQFNKYALMEHKILSDLSDNYRIYWLVDASHDIWFNELYKKEILERIMLIMNVKEQMGGNHNHHNHHNYQNQYLKNKKKYLQLE